MASLDGHPVTRAKQGSPLQTLRGVSHQTIRKKVAKVHSRLGTFQEVALGVLIDANLLEHS